MQYRTVQTLYPVTPAVLLTELSLSLTGSTTPLYLRLFSQDAKFPTTYLTLYNCL